MIVGNYPSDLDAIRQLPRRGLDNVRFLEVHFNPWRDDRNHNDNICHVHGKHGFNGHEEDVLLERSLESITVADFSIIWALDRFCGYLAGVFSHDPVHLTLFCSAESPDIAARIHKSIEQMQTWHTCIVRLDIRPALSLGLPARSTIGKLTRRVFPFFKLPAEIRFRILGYTDLHPRIGSNPYSEDLFVVNGRLRTSYWIYRGDHDSFRTIPFPLFLVSKQMEQEAEDVLFLYNCLDIGGGILEAPNYLTSSPKGRLRAISYLRLYFTPEDLSLWIQATRSAWRVLVKFMRNNLNNSRLCLAIDICEHAIPVRWKVDNANVRFEYEAICELALDLRELKLEDLHLILPQALTFLETLLEQKVVAPGYNSSRGNRRAKDVSSSWSKPSIVAGQRPIRFGRGRMLDGCDELEMYNELPAWHNKLPAWHIRAWEAIVRCYNITDEEH